MNLTLVPMGSSRVSTAFRIRRIALQL